MKPGDNDNVRGALRGASSAAICSSWYWISGRPSHGSSAFGVVVCDEFVSDAAGVCDEIGVSNAAAMRRDSPAASSTMPMPS